MKKKFSVIDRIIILLVVGVIAFGVFKLIEPVINVKKFKEPVQFTVLLSGIDEESADLIAEGDEIYLNFGDNATAEITSVSKQPYLEKMFVAPLGKYVAEPAKDKVDVLVGIKSKAFFEENEIQIDNISVRVGEGTFVRGKGYSFHGYIVEVQE